MNDFVRFVFFYPTVVIVFALVIAFVIVIIGSFIETTIDSINKKRHEIDIKYLEARETTYSKKIIPWSIPMQDYIDTFDYEKIIEANLLFDIKLFRQISVKALTESLDKTTRIEYFNLYTNLVEKYNRANQ